MDKKEKVMKGLACCKVGVLIGEEFPYEPKISCENCPYESMHADPQAKNCMEQLCEDALELLEEQEPRVMSVEEAAKNAYSYYHTPDSVKPVFVQFRDKIYADEGLAPPWRGGVNQRALLKEPNRYGKDFVFWTDRPSEEQMKGVKWDGRTGKGDEGA